MAPNAETFRNALKDEFRRAEAAGMPYIDVRSGRLHEQVGGYPAGDGNHRMRTCCMVMYGEKSKDDEVLKVPPKGNGATLVIRYTLPR